MSFYVEQRWKSTLLNQAYIIVYSILAAIIGVNYMLFILVIVFVIISMFLQSYLSGSPIGKNTKANEVLQGKRLYHEPETRSIQVKDKQVMLDFQEQSRFTMYTTIGMFIGLIYFFVLFKYVPDLSRFLGNYIADYRIDLFLGFLIYFEGYFAINMLNTMWAVSRIKKLPMVNVPSQYTVTDKGIVIKGMLTTKGIAFPLPNETNVNLNEERRFVEIVKEGKRTITKLRFYSKNPKRLYEIIKKYGKMEQTN
ncbi:MAG: DUF2208 domain-containing protein [Caldisphaera sp.]|uniref:DUF2208 domain-containing protein n=1 Tax=Caldisphaera sp. TaxID=2060322 RepID=UPI000CB6AFB4|nr:MAG: DUF2208 domain-containing protein [Caldisphaera sp.]PMP89140.1 MAG: DUF2208 domain-containing protein [Caldisphaera sp.]